MHILGIDFSGALLAGRKIWVSHGILENGSLRFETLKRGADLASSGEERAVVYPALMQWISSFTDAICGMDFPFSLSQPSVGENWRAWMKNEVMPCPDADTFKSRYLDVRRQCDIDAKTPFSPLNKRLYKQTFHGLHDVIGPLLLKNAVVLPFDEPQNNGLRLVEICPASLLKKEKLYLSYKGKSGSQKENRGFIWQEMHKRTGFVADKSAKNAAIEDSEGDALDAVLAALCVQRSLNEIEKVSKDKLRKIEGHVYY